MSQNWPGQKMGNMPAVQPAPQPAPQAPAQTSGGPVLREVLSVPSERKDREEQRDITRLGVTLQGEQRAASKEQFDRITTYRKEFLTEPTVRQFREVENAASQIIELAKRDSDQPGPSDISLIFSFMKILDPGSVVRTEEFATAENAGGVPETVRNAYNKLLSGGRLTPELKREFASTAASVYNSRLNSYNTFVRDYRGLIEAEGADPDAQGVRLAEPITFGEPSTPGERPAGAGETFLTARDKELQDKLSQAYASGATLAELQALAQQYGQTIPIASQEELDAARAQGRGIVVTPTGMGVPDPREEMGFIESIGETLTGSERSTPEIEALPDWATMPELNSLSVDSFQAALGTMITNPQESVAIIRAQFPGVQVRQDEKGNFILRSAADGQEYAIKPGFRVSDIPRALGGLAAFTPAGRATTAGGAAISGGLTQAGIEASQAATGGEFNAEEVLLASGGNVLGQQIGRGVNAVRNARAVRTAAPEVAPAPASAPQTPEAPPVVNRLYSERIGGPEFKPGDKLPAYAHRNIFNKDELQSIIDDGFMLPPSGRRNKYFTMSDEPLPKPGNREGIAIRVPSEKVPFDRAVAARDVELWDNALGAWRPLVASTRSVTDELAAPPLAPEMQAEVGEIARQAIGRGKSARDAQEQLAIMAKVNPEAKAAAERLGMDLPIDILSDDTRLLTVAGLARSQAGSDAEAAWKNLAIDTIEKADASLEQVGASRNLAGVSNEVRTTLQSNMDELEAGANSLREEVNAAINVQDRVAANNLQRELGKTIDDLGGIDEAKQAFSAEEKKLLTMLGEGDVAKRPTYARLDRIRNQVGEALFKGKGPWVDTEEATLKRYYGALAKDRLDYVAEVGGADLADKMRVSNDLYSKMYDVRTTMQTLFGKQLENDISTTISNAIKQGSSGDAKNLRKIIDNVPEDMQAKTLLTGLMAASGRSGPNGGFSFTKYADVYRGLRENAPVYSVIAKTIGPDADRILRDLYSISKRMARGENAVIKTGKSNQPLINALAAEGLVSSVAKASAKRAAVTGASSIAGGLVGGPFGSGLAAGTAEAIQQAVSTGGKSNLDKLHGVLVSEPFKNLAEKAAAGAVKDADVNRVANDKSWRRFASTLLGINDSAGRKAWLRKAITAAAPTQATPEQQPTSTIEVR